MKINHIGTWSKFKDTFKKLVLYGPYSLILMNVSKNWAIKMSLETFLYFRN